MSQNQNQQGGYMNNQQFFNQNGTVPDQHIPYQNNFPQNQQFPGNMNQQGFNQPQQQMGFPPQGPNFYQQGFYQPQYQQPEPESRHEHPLDFNGKIDDKCKICLINVGDKGGYKCKECPIILCINCSQRIFYGIKNNQIHEHDLFLTDRNNWNCNLCKKNYSENASFYCKNCNFDVCDKCFIVENQPQPQAPPQQYQQQYYQPYQQEAYAQQQGGYQQYQDGNNYPYQGQEQYQMQQDEELQPESDHEHPLNYESSLNNNCLLCLKSIGGKDGYKCNECPMILCLDCSDKVFYGMKNKSVHEHELMLKVRNIYRCKVCNKPRKSKASFYCSQCNFDVCSDCYIDVNGQGNQQQQQNNYNTSQNQQYQQGAYAQGQGYYEEQEPEAESTHEHPLHYEQKSNFTCRLCRLKKNGEEGYKCKDCPLVLCFNCSDRIFYGNKKKSLHQHDLHLRERNKWKCNICKNSNKANASFYCSKCDFDACADCFIDNKANKVNNNNVPNNQQQPQQQKSVENIHEHPLNYEEKLKDTCKLCSKKINNQKGYKCKQCPLVLCSDCSNKVLNKEKNKSVHQHDLILNNRKSWKCNVCNKQFKNIPSFYCKQCDFDSCVNCYLKK